jgi:hypothetical protein
MLTTLTLGGVIGCSDSSPEDPSGRSAAVYSEVLQWFAASSSSDPDPLPVFLEPRGEGASIPLPVQAELIAELSDVADLRFIDSRDEAIVVDDDGVAAVADDGILLRLSPVDEVSEPVQVDVDLYLAGEDMITFRFELDHNGEGWSVTGPPEQLATPSLGPDDA